MVAFEQMSKLLPVSDSLTKVKLSEVAVAEDLEDVAQPTVCQMEGLAGRMIENAHIRFFLSSVEKGMGGSVLVSLGCVQRVDLTGQRIQTVSLELVRILENQEAQDGQNNRDDEHQHADTEDRTCRLHLACVGQCSVVADDIQTNTGQQAGDCHGGLHQEGLRRTGDRFIAFAELHFAVVDDVRDAAGGRAERQAGAEEDECAAQNNRKVVGRDDIARHAQQHQTKNRKAAGEEVDLLTVDAVRDSREQEQADHLKDDRKAKDCVQAGVTANFLEIVYRKTLEDLGAEIEGQQQADKSDELVVFDNNRERFLEAGLGRLCTDRGRLLDVEDRDGNADDEQHNNRDGGVGEAGLGNVENAAVILGLHDRGVACHAVEEVDHVQAEGADHKAAQRRADTRYDRDGLALARVGGQVGQPGPVRDVHHRIAHAIQDVGYGHIDHQLGLILNAEGSERQDKEHRVDQCADGDPDAELAEAGTGVVHDHAHHWVVDRIPDARCKEQYADKGAAQAKRIRVVQHQERADQIDDRILTDRADAESVFLPRRQPARGVVLFFTHGESPFFSAGYGNVF